MIDDSLFYKEKPSDKIWIYDAPNTFEQILFSFDKKTIFSKV